MLETKRKSKIKDLFMVVVVGLAAINYLFFNSESNVEHSDLKYEQMVYEHVSEEKIDALVNEDLTNGTDKIDIIAQSQWQKKFNKLYTKLSTMSILADIKYYIGEDDRDYAEERSYCEEMLQKLEDSYNALYKDDYNETEASELDELYLKRMDEEVAYRNLCDEVAERTNTDFEKKQEARDKMEVVDGLEENTNGDEDIFQWTSEEKKKAGEILLRLAKIDNRMAKLEGYDSTIEMMYDSYGRDYTPEEMKAFYKNVKAVVTPALKKVYDYNQQLKIPDSIFDFKQVAMLNNIEAVLKDTSLELKRCFDYMRKYNLYKLDFDPLSSGEGYTWYIDEYKEPYTYIEASDKLTMANSILHEFGHFFADFTVENPNASVDIQETFSQGMEALTIPKAEDVMDSQEEADNLEAETIYNLLSGLSEGCLYDEFLLKIYENPNITVDQVDQIFNNLKQEYGLEDDAYVWEDVQHNYTMPFYYISYSISAVPALEIWNEAEQDYKKAASQYLKLVKNTSEDANFIESIEAAGFNDPFDRQTLQVIMDNVIKHFDKEEAAWAA